MLPEETASCSVGLFSQYVSRGVSYTHEGPAVQGGRQYSHRLGWYLGFWFSNVSDYFGSNALSAAAGLAVWPIARRRRTRAPTGTIWD